MSMRERVIIEYCTKCGHSCHCRDVCTVRTDEDETVSICECNDCRCIKERKA
jgi:hypothetical protein